MNKYFSRVVWKGRFENINFEIAMLIGNPYGDELGSNEWTGLGRPRAENVWMTELVVFCMAIALNYFQSFSQGCIQAEASTRFHPISVFGTDFWTMRFEILQLPLVIAGMVVYGSKYELCKCTCDCQFWKISQVVSWFYFSGVLVLFLAFFAFLHCWLNAFAEMLRFADRMFYKVT